MDAFNAIGCTIFDIPGYFFFTGVGLVLSISVFIILVAEKKYSLPQNMKTLFLSAIFVIFSARGFGCLSGIYRDIGMGYNITWSGIKNTGIVFYGGLFGLLISYRIISRKLKQDIHIMDILAVCIPLFHSISRIGCFFGGCCFGIESKSPIAINYTTAIFGEEVTAYRIPVQLIEAGFNMLLFIYFLHLLRSREWTEKNLLNRYLLLYSIGRFVIEFFRGDIVRGVLYGISFSQIVCILVWIYLLITFWKEKKEVLEI